MFIGTNDRRETGPMLPVHAAGEIEYLVKESEIVTGRPGRKFIIAGADRLAYLVQWHSIGYQIQRLDAAGNPVSTLTLPSDALPLHQLGQALQVGQLFTLSVSQ